MGQHLRSLWTYVTLKLGKFTNFKALFPAVSKAFFEGLIFGGAYVRREIYVSKLIGLACSGKEIYHFCFVLLCILGQIRSTSLPRGLYLEGRFNGGFFVLRYWGAYIWRGLLLEFYGTRLLVDNAVIKSYT